MAPSRQIRSALRAIAAVILLVIASGPATPVRVSADSPNEVFSIPAPTIAVRPNARLEEAVLQWLNDMRVGQHLRPLQVDVMLRAIARAYGQEMFEHGYLSHVSRDGRTLEDRLGGRGLRFNVVGENLAYAPDIRAADLALWQSAPHRRNIMYPAFRAVGIAVIDGRDDGVIVVEDFSDTSPAVETAGQASIAAGGRAGGGRTGAPRP
ncbi:MAG TPA: CAP domain-containing protein [bacterium]|nr:CAP domain-containing protein [bacterium]